MSATVDQQIRRVAPQNRVGNPLPETFRELIRIRFRIEFKILIQRLQIKQHLLIYSTIDRLTKNLLETLHITNSNK